ncbi:hypothetical protein EDD16DRAFT_1674508 [Pisolithus croceorrhizus]|nr:hypothetical protein EDD16DRAFT_1674508 [Pisolithus croceorrhizus]
MAFMVYPLACEVPLTLLSNISQCLCCPSQCNLPGSILLNRVLVPYLCLNSYISCCRCKVDGIIYRKASLWL